MNNLDNYIKESLIKNHAKDSKIKIQPTKDDIAAVALCYILHKLDDYGPFKRLLMMHKNDNKFTDYHIEEAFRIVWHGSNKEIQKYMEEHLDGPEVFDPLAD